MKDKYTVVMSVYDKENPLYFYEAIESVINQTVPPNEFIIICDGPINDKLQNVIDYYKANQPDLFRIMYLKENKGLGTALHYAVKKAKYDLIARMDSDDISYPYRAEKQLEYLKSHPEISVVGGQIAEFNGNIHNIKGYRKVPLSSSEIKKVLKFRNPMNHVTVMFRKNDILEAGNYQKMIGFEDYYLWTRLIKNGYLLSNMEDVLVNVRVNDAMYQRRGGFSYFKDTLKFQHILLENRLINHFEFIRNLIIRFLSTVVITNSLRETLFLKFMRKDSI